MKHNPKNREDRPIHTIVMNLEILNRTRKWIAAAVVLGMFFNS